MAVKHAILGLLHYSDMHGYRIKTQIERYFGHIWSINYGQIYPNLKTMLAEELIDMLKVSQAGERGPSRKLYSITPKGREAFAEWITSSPENSMVLRDPFLMRFVFFRFGDKERALEMIDDQIRAYKEQLSIRREIPMHKQDRDIYVALISELGIQQNELFLKWLKKAKTKIRLNDFC